MYADSIGIISKDSKNLGFLTKFKVTNEELKLDQLKHQNSTLKKDYESLKLQLQTMTKDHLSFFETFQLNFKKQEEILKEISQMSNEAEDEIIKTKAVLLSKQEKIQYLQNKIQDKKLDLELRGRQVSLYKSYFLTWPVLLASFLFTFFLVCYKKVSEQVVY